MSRMAQVIHGSIICKECDGRGEVPDGWVYGDMQPSAPDKMKPCSGCGGRGFINV